MDDAARMFLDSAAVEIDRIFEGYRAGRLPLDSGPVSTLKETRTALLSLEGHPDAEVRARLAVLTGRIDGLLDQVGIDAVHEVGVAHTPRRNHRRLYERLAGGAVLAATAVVLSLVAVHNDSTAAKWKKLYQEQARVSTQAARQVKQANSNIATLDTEVKALRSQVSSLQSQLASVANQKEKALDQTTVDDQLISAAGQVADDLQTCIAATNQLDHDLTSGPAGTNPSKAGNRGNIEAEVQQVDQTCGQAESDNAALQAAIQGDG